MRVGNKNPEDRRRKKKKQQSQLEKEIFSMINYSVKKSLEETLKEIFQTFK